MPENVLVLGATNNPQRYAYMAAELLTAKKHNIIPVGIKKGKVFGKDIVYSKEVLPDVDTITLYIGPKNQEEWLDYIVETKPGRVIFNPGTENAVLREKLDQAGIFYEHACTLVMLRTGSF